MLEKKKFRIFRLSVWHFVFPLIIGFVITLVAYPQGFRSVSSLTFIIAYSLCIGIMAMKSYEYSEWQIEKFIPWLKRPVLRFFVSITTESVIGFIVLFLVNYLFFKVIKGLTVDEFLQSTIEAIKYLLTSTIAGIIIINLISFFKNWRQSALNEEILKREILAAQYESLKNQINPHFLFNNLTALTSLVRTDPDNAVIFIQELANTFRYVLENRECEVIELARECSLIESLTQIYHLRYGSSLNINLKINNFQDKYIIPMALQMLVENAVKHNVISKSNPLTIDIYEEGDYLVVKNNFQPKTSKILSNGLGIKNIQMRYHYHSSQEVIIEKSEHYFTVKLPILMMLP